MLNKMNYLAGLFLVAVLWGECSAQRTVTLSSPDGTNTIQFFPVSESIENSPLSFSILRGKALVLLPSEIKLSAEEIDFASPYAITHVEETSIRSEWVTDFGERKNIPDHYNQVKIYLESDTAKLNIIARAYNEGVAFAYEVPKQSDLKTLHIKEELITYNFLDDF
ncbi:glycoside hydrolase family 97 N-terminal domain-containing protein [Planctomycetota bacterium]